VPSEPCVLIVEADIVVRHPLAEYLRECGYRVLEASNAEEARRLLEAMASSIDLVFADAAGPRNEGFELAGWIRRTQPSIEVVLAGGVVKAVEKANEICEDGPALAKPYEHKLILDRIRRALAARERGSRDR
jgi:DNA-binding response OmpR family regulator